MMPMAMEYYPSNVCDGLERLCKRINIDNRRNMTNLNRLAEYFFVEFLNLLFGLELKNANPENPNRPGFDLIDEKNQIIVQVSSECTHKKIQEALGNSADKVGFHFYFVAIRASYSPREPFDVPTTLQFDYTKDVLDIKRLMDSFDECGIEKQAALSALIDQYFGRTAPLREPDKPAPSRDPQIADRLQDFQCNWAADAFLTEGVPLKDIYYPPQCYLNGNKSNRLNLTEVERKLKNSRKKEILILGQPGSGKSTLISQFVSTYLGERQIIVYRCRTLGIKDWNDKKIYETILSINALSNIYLNNSILILDGLDEVADKKTLDEIFKNLITSHRNSIARQQAAYLVITCRENYIKKLNAAGAYDYIQLCPFDAEQIHDFCKNYGKAVREPVSEETVAALCKNRAVYGIPLIAYIVLALGIKANAESGIMDVYDQIFDPQSGGIYKRPYDLCADTGGEKEWRKLHKLSQDIALWIFHNNFKEADIPKDRLDQFAKECGLEPQKGLDHFRKLHHSESGNQSVTFIHRSMMEYFVADTIAREICPDRGKPADDPSEAIRNVSGMLYWENIDSGECGEYLSKMLEAGFRTLEEGKKEEVYQKWELAVFRQLEAGVPLQKIPEKVELSFAIRLDAVKISCANLIRVLHKLRYICGTSEKTGFYAREQMGTARYDNTLPLYIRSYSPYSCLWFLIDCDLIGTNLYGADLRDANLRGADLRGADLRSADLRDVDLDDVDLSGADLSGADLRDAPLFSANLHNANLRSANLSRALLLGANLGDANLCGTNLGSADLHGANLDGANLSGVYLDDAVLDKDFALTAIEALRATMFDFIRIEDNTGRITPYSRERFFATFDK